MDPSNFILEYRWICSTKRKNTNVLERFANAIIGWYHQRGSMYAARRDFRLFLCRYIRSNVDEIAGEWVGDNVRNFRSRDHCGTILPPLSFKNLFRLEAKIEEIRIESLSNAIRRFSRRAILRFLWKIFDQYWPCSQVNTMLQQLIISNNFHIKFSIRWREWINECIIECKNVCTFLYPTFVYNNLLLFFFKFSNFRAFVPKKISFHLKYLLSNIFQSVESGVSLYIQLFRN